MKSASILSLKNSIAISLQQVRQQTLKLLSEIDETSFSTQVHPDFSPIGWHFGHIAFTEAYWILEYLAQSPPGFSEYRLLFAADGLPKKERENLPSLIVIENYLATIRTTVLQYLESAPLEKQERLWRWLIQHECQHCETITFLWKLYCHQNALESHPDCDRLKLNKDSPNSFLGEMLEIEAGEFILGSNEVFAQDNERPAHKIYLDTYWIDRFLVTWKEYAEFMAVGGYQKSQYWSPQGWQWLQENAVDRPLYWQHNCEKLNFPVYGVSYYEAEAYAKFVNKRLPTEAEWEKAALFLGSNGCKEMLGNVWQWTSSWFDGYPSFFGYPYPGYSQVYFDRQHRVLRGGSWATNSYALRTTFRNWYHPHVRQIIAGFRCAR